MKALHVQLEVDRLRSREIQHQTDLIKFTMPRFNANLSWLFQEKPFSGRFAAAADAGFTGVEILFPYDQPASEIRAALAIERAGVGPDERAAGQF